MNVVALCGSLRAASINLALLKTAARLAPSGMTIAVFDGLGRLPLFNPDLDNDLPAPVADFHARIAAADAVLIASPEYAHGVTGTIKNALDWLVGYAPFAGTPVALWNAAPRAHHADDALREILRTMAAFIVEPGSITLALVDADLDEDRMIASVAMTAAMRQALSVLDDAMRGHHSVRSTSLALP